MENEKLELTFEQWLHYGEINGFCSAIFCFTHDGPPSSETEQRLWEEGSDPCCFAVRVGSEEDWESDARALLDL